MRKAIEDTFGSNALGHALFYNHPLGMRFELSESSAPSYIHMFLQAYQKATEITDLLFTNAKELRVAICFYSYGDGSFLSSLSRFKSIAACGIKIPNSYTRVREEQENKVPVNQQGIIMTSHLGRVCEGSQKCLYGIRS